MAASESPALVSKYQTCLFASVIPTMSAFENSQTAFSEFELSPSADTQTLSFIASPEQRPRVPANSNSHAAFSQVETPSYLFLKIFFPPVSLSNTPTNTPMGGKAVGCKPRPNPVAG